MEGYQKPVMVVLLLYFPVGDAHWYLSHIIVATDEVQPLLRHGCQRKIGIRH